MKNKNKLMDHELAVERLSSELLEGSRFAKQCCVCKKVKLGEFWVRDAVEAPGRKIFSHGYCPSCFRATLQTIDHYSGELKN